MHPSVRRVLRRAVPRGLVNALRAPGPTLRWAWHEARYRCGLAETVDVTPGWRVRCHPTSRIVFEIHREEEEFRLELDGFVRACRPGMTLVDVGAHVGFFTLAALHHAPAGRVIAVEPSRHARRVLRANLALAGAADRVRVETGALGARGGQVRLLDGGAGTMYQLIRPADVRPDTAGLAATTLDALVERVGWEPTHVKIDVEGYEAEVIEGGRATLGRLRPVVFLELHNTLLRQLGRRPEDLLGDLAALGYTHLERHGEAIGAEAALAPAISRLVCRPPPGRRRTEASHQLTD